MNNCNKKYMTELLGFSYEVEGIEMDFKDKKLEENYRASNSEKEIQKSKLFCLLCCIAYILSIIYSLIINNFKPVISTYSHSICILVEIVLAKVSYLKKNNYIIVKKLKYIRFFFFYFDITILLLFPANFIQDMYLRYIYATMLYINLLYLFYLDFNVILVIIVSVLNSLLILIIQYKFSFPKYYFVPELVINFIYYFVTFLIKKYEFSTRKETFYEHYKNEQYIEYINQLIDVLNTMVISIKKKDLLFMNNLAVNFFKVIYPINEEKKEVEYETVRNLLVDKYFIPSNIIKKLYSFFDTLSLNTPFDNNGHQFDEGKTFSEVVSQIFSDEKFESRHFTRVGYFRVLNDKKFFDICVRKLKYKDDVLEIFIHDITHMKMAEEVSIETKYKQKILAKIAHEFKTPLITITSLIHKIMEKQKETRIEDPNIRCLNHINNLSNYTIVLISDIIQYASDSIDLRLNIVEVNLRDELEFCYNVLKTLVECNENKANKIKTSIIIDDIIDSLEVATDQNRLKQIILNLISNSVKFTLSGYIKMIVKYLPQNNSVVIRVKDSGMGIKDTDNHLIFQENVQLCVNHEYNSKGSGLGLSIVKNLAQSLNHKISFKSTYGKGSRFSLEMQCLIKVNKNKNYLEDKSMKIEQSVKSIEFEKDISQFTNKEELKHLSCKQLIKDYSIIIDSDISMKNNSVNRLKQNELHEYQYNWFPPNFVKEQFCFCLPSLIPNNNYNIVVVDDNKFIRESSVNLIKNVLKTLKINDVDIIEGSDGIDLLNMVRSDKSYKIKSIFIDENMEYLNGSDAIKIVRKMEDNKKVRVYNLVSITAFEDNESKNRILSSGANSIISKPCTKSDITKILSNLF